MRDENSTELVVLPGAGLTEGTDDIVASAERRIAKVDKIIELSLRRTNENDWVDQQGKPYLTCSGGEKIARLFGISWKILKSEKIHSEDEKGKFYFYQVTGVFTLGKSIDSIEAVGTCNSKDQFFAKVHGELKPVSEVEETNIMKAAYSNCVVNGITRLLGIRNLTWEQVQRGGIDKTKVTSVKYADGGAGGGKISEAQGKRLWAISKSAGKKEEELKKYLKEKYKLDHIADIGKNDYESICNWAEGKVIEGEVVPEQTKDNKISEITFLANKKGINALQWAKKYINEDIDTLNDLTIPQLTALLRSIENASGVKK